MTTLYVREGNDYKEASGQDILERANALISQRYRAGAPVLSSPARTREFLRLRLGGLDHEIFAILFLDNRHRLIEYVELFRGTIDGASVHPREVVKEALARNAASLVCAHCHPSGNSTPSHADEHITQRLKEALQLVDIRLLDHLLGGFWSVTPHANCAEIQPTPIRDIAPMVTVFGRRSPLCPAYKRNGSPELLRLIEAR